MLETIDEDEAFVESHIDTISLKNRISFEKSLVFKSGSLTWAFRLESASSLNVRVWFSPHPFAVPRSAVLQSRHLPPFCELLSKSQFTTVESFPFQPVF